MQTLQLCTCGKQLTHISLQEHLLSSRTCRYKIGKKQLMASKNGMGKWGTLVECSCRYVLDQKQLRRHLSSEKHANYLLWFQTGQPVCTICQIAYKDTDVVHMSSLQHLENRMRREDLATQNARIDLHPFQLCQERLTLVNAELKRTTAVMERQSQARATLVITRLHQDQQLKEREVRLQEARKREILDQHRQGNSYINLENVAARQRRTNNLINNQQFNHPVQPPQPPQHQTVPLQPNQHVQRVPLASQMEDEVINVDSNTEQVRPVLRRSPRRPNNTSSYNPPAVLVGESAEITQRRNQRQQRQRQRSTHRPANIDFHEVHFERLTDQQIQYIVAHSQQPMVRECGICHQFVNQEVGIQLQCNHQFHTEEITAWLERAGNCPICKCPARPLGLPN